MQRPLPQRTCVACRRVRPKRELIRVVRGTTGTLSVDLKGKANGRGAYLCPEAECLERGLAAGSLAKELETPIDEQTMKRLREELAAGVSVRVGGR
ncbi:MAG: YlxR family protein [Chloroflexi bacterium]|nr:YlxR family protein [Chloroflexota bacterium]